MRRSLNNDREADGGAMRADHRSSMSRWSVYAALQEEFTRAVEVQGLNANRELERIMAEYVQEHPTLITIERQRQIVEHETKKLAEMEAAAVQQTKQAIQVTVDNIEHEISAYVADSKGHKPTTKTVRFWAINTAKRLGRNVDHQEIERRALASLRAAGIDVAEAN